jgi:hypothetical protein
MEREFDYTKFFTTAFRDRGFTSTVAVSGGIDSTMVLYFLSRYITEQGLKPEIECRTIELPETRPIVKPLVDKIVGFMRKEFPHITYNQLYASIPNEKKLKDISKDKFREGKTKLSKEFLNPKLGIFNGMSRNLPYEMTKIDWPDFMAIRNEKPINQLFGEYDKREVRMQVFMYNLQDSLLPNTISCLDPPTNDRHCGKCRGCLEYYAVFPE